MAIIRLLVLALTTGMTVITVVVGVTVLLGMGWLAVAVPVLLVVGILAVGRALWRRCLPGPSPTGTDRRDP